MYFPTSDYTYIVFLVLELCQWTYMCIWPWMQPSIVTLQHQNHVICTCCTYMGWGNPCLEFGKKLIYSRGNITISETPLKSSFKMVSVHV